MSKKKIFNFLEKELNKNNIFQFVEDISDKNIIDVFFIDTGIRFAILYIDKLEMAIKSIELCYGNKNKYGNETKEVKE